MSTLRYPEWFLANKIRVFPIKPKDKVPACKSWDDFIATPAETRKWVNYGVALGYKENVPGGGLAVADTDTPEAEAWARRELPKTPFFVRTGKGVHRYYRVSQHVPNFIHRDGHTIEFRNSGQYVVGPGSLHKTGHVYTADPWDREFDQIPLFPVETFLWDDRSGNTVKGLPISGDGYVPPKHVAAGERHDQMYRLLRSFQSRGIPDAVCIEMCVRMNAEMCVPPLAEREVRSHLTRVCKMPDRAGWVRRTASSGWDIFLGFVDHDGDLDDEGRIQTILPRDVVLYAARAIDKDFDESKGPPEDPSLSASDSKRDDSVPPDEEKPFEKGMPFDHEEDETSLDLVEDPS